MKDQLGQVEGDVTSTRTAASYRLGLGNSWGDTAALACRKALLQQGQAMPLSVKIGKAQALIMQVLNERPASECYLAFSGGRDSAVVGHMIEMIDPAVEFVFCDTTLEFRETRDYIAWWESQFGRRITRIYPAIKPLEVFRRYGYPFFSKLLAREFSRRTPPTAARLRVFQRSGVLHALDSGVAISDRCCEMLKHGPAERYAIQRGLTAVFSGMMASESSIRRRNWLSRGCYYPVQHGADRVWPLAFWSQQDVIEYHRLYSLPKAKLYDYGFKRNGCMVCGFGCHIARPNKFELLRHYDEQLWRKLMEYFGLFDACHKLRIRTGEEILW